MPPLASAAVFGVTALNELFCEGDTSTWFEHALRTNVDREMMII
ncbi:hypothetical protein [Sulfuricurvum sp.]|nr:hypothetical protein [Sulfuricurvum sp.]HZF70803.1 hypothetical protein [Sulfuricurvum sp.]